MSLDDQKQKFSDLGCGFVSRSDATCTSFIHRTSLRAKATRVGGETRCGSGYEILQAQRPQDLDVYTGPSREHLREGEWDAYEAVGLGENVSGEFVTTNGVRRSISSHSGECMMLISHLNSWLPYSVMSIWCSVIICGNLSSLTTHTEIVVVDSTPGRLGQHEVSGGPALHDREPIQQRQEDKIVE